MPTSLPTSAIEKSSYFISFEMRDENDDLIDPLVVDWIRWTLTNPYGDVINERYRQEIAKPFTNPVKIILKGLDLMLDGVTDEQRHFTVEAQYDSIDATDLPFNDYATFTVKSCIALT
jgi:hypothetical protein